MKKEELFFNVFLKVPYLRSKLMKIALFLYSRNLFIEKIDGLNAYFVVTELSVNTGYLLGEMMVCEERS